MERWVGVTGKAVRRTAPEEICHSLVWKAGWIHSQEFESRGKSRASALMTSALSLEPKGKSESGDGGARHDRGS